jgi:hypothetical protein
MHGQFTERMTTSANRVATKAWNAPYAGAWSFTDLISLAEYGAQLMQTQLMQTDQASHLHTSPLVYAAISEVHDFVIPGSAQRPQMRRMTGGCMR